MRSFSITVCYYVYYCYYYVLINVHAQFQYFPIPVSVHTYPGLFLWSHSSSPPSPLLSHQSLHYFGEICLLILLTYLGHTLGLFGSHKFLGYQCLAFFFFFSILSTFSSKLFCVNSRLFVRSLIYFSTHVFLVSLVWSYH